MDSVPIVGSDITTRRALFDRTFDCIRQLPDLKTELDSESDSDPIPNRQDGSEEPLIGVKLLGKLDNAPGRVVLIAVGDATRPDEIISYE